MKFIKALDLWIFDLDLDHFGNPAISPKIRVSRCTSTLCQSYYLHDIQLPQKKTHWSKFIYMKHALVYPKPQVLRHVVDFEVVTLTAIFKTCNRL